MKFLILVITGLPRNADKKTRVAKLTGLTSFPVQLNKSQVNGESDVVRGDCVEVSRAGNASVAKLTSLAAPNLSL